MKNNLNIENPIINSRIVQKKSTRDLFINVELLDITEEEAEIEVSSRCLAEGDPVILCISMSYKGESVKINCKCDVASWEHCDDESFIYGLKINVVNHKKLNKYFELYKQRQADIIQFMDLAKGISA